MYLCDPKSLYIGAINSNSTISGSIEDHYFTSKDWKHHVCHSLNSENDLPLLTNDGYSRVMVSL